MNISSRERIIMTCIGSFLVAASIGWILSPEDLIASGLTGILQLVGMATGIYLNIELNLGILYFVANFPLLILAYFKLSKKYMYFSVLSVIIQTIILLIPSPLPADFYELGTLEMALVGGSLIGVGIGLCLKVGASTGGFDILFQYISLNSNISFNNINLLINSIIIAIAVAIQDFQIAIGIYTIMRLFITVMTISFTNRNYNIIEARIFTNNSEDVTKVIIEKTNRGVSIIEKTGGYTGKTGMMLVVYMNRYELRMIRRDLFKIDKNCLIAVNRVEKVIGNFKKKIIN